MSVKSIEHFAGARGSPIVDHLTVGLLLAFQRTILDGSDDHGPCWIVRGTDLHSSGSVLHGRVSVISKHHSLAVNRDGAGHECIEHVPGLEIPIQAAGIYVCHGVRQVLSDNGNVGFEARDRG